MVLDEGWYALGDVLKVVPGHRHAGAHSPTRARRTWASSCGWSGRRLDDQLQPALDQLREVGHEGDQGRLHAARRPAGDRLLPPRLPRGRQAEAARRLPRRAAARADDAHLAQPHLHRRRDGPRADKWSHDTDPEHDVTLPFTRMFLGPMDYTPGAMGNAARASLRPDLRAAHEPGHALPPARDVRRLREPAADAGRQPVDLRGRARGDGVPGAGADGVGRDARARRRHRRLRGGRPPQGQRLVRRRHDRLDGARTSSIDLSFLPAGTLRARRLRGRRRTPTARQRLPRRSSRVDRTTRFTVHLRRAAAGPRASSERPATGLEGEGLPPGRRRSILRVMQLGPLEQRVLDYLWRRRDPPTVREVRSASVRTSPTPPS